MTIMDSTGKYSANATLKNALYIPSYPQDIFSVQAATEKEATITFQPQDAELIYRDGTIFNIKKYGKLYYLHVGPHIVIEKILIQLVIYTNTLKGWHEVQY